MNRLAFLLLVLRGVTEAAVPQFQARSIATVTSNNCTLFSTNDTQQSVFTNYRFYDFRNVYTPSSSSTSSNISNTTTTPKSATRIATSGSVQVFKVVSDPTAWKSDWTPRNRYSAAASSNNVALNYTAARVYLQNITDPIGSTELTPYTTHPVNVSKQQYSAGLDYLETPVAALSVRVMARINGAPGAVAGFFTYMNDSQESDIQILSSNPTNSVHFSNQPTQNIHGNNIAGAQFNVSVAGNWNYWTELRLDWLPGGSEFGSGSSLPAESLWWVNDTLAANMTVNVPAVNSKAVINFWSNGGSFSGLMPTGASAVLNIAWIEMVFNTTPATVVRPGQLCSLEGQPGNPVPEPVVPINNPPTSSSSTTTSTTSLSRKSSTITTSSTPTSTESFITSTTTSSSKTCSTATTNSASSSITTFTTFTTSSTTTRFKQDKLFRNDQFESYEITSGSTSNTIMASAAGSSSDKITQQHQYKELQHRADFRHWRLLDR